MEVKIAIRVAESGEVSVNAKAFGGGMTEVAAALEQQSRQEWTAGNQRDCYILQWTASMLNAMAEANAPPAPAAESADPDRFNGFDPAAPICIANNSTWAFCGRLKLEVKSVEPANRRQATCIHCLAEADRRIRNNAW